MLETSAIILMIVLHGYIWGGLIYFVNRAYKKEKRGARTTT
jgi:hypothetical protein